MRTAASGMLALAAALAAGLALFAGDAVAQKPDQGKGKGQGPAEARAARPAVAAPLTPNEVAIIREYFRGPSAPAAYRGVKPLPPGVQKNLARGKPLPPGIARRAVPNDLLFRLSVPWGHSFAVVGTDVVLIQASTNLVVDVVKAALR